jgi:glucosyl-dolichyl phosphate glucuronosyltransferase
MPRDSRALPGISVIICTYNRADLLPEAIENVLAQEGIAADAFELIVVDNNSNDRTREVVTAFSARDERVRYLFERAQGLSHARNAGIAVARAPIITFTDDDVRVGRGWLAAILEVCAEHPDADVIGGRVLPDWPAPPPAWLTTRHWSPLALVDYGDRPVQVSAANPLCLVGANLTVRRRAFDLVGSFAPDLQRVRDGVGSCEDLEFLLRLYRAGRFGIYDPRITIHAAVQHERLDRAYHRRWHIGQGHFHALMRADQLEQSGIGRLFGVPAHLYRQAARHGLGWIRARARGDASAAFAHEAALLYFRGFHRTRRREFRNLPAAERLGEFSALVRALIQRRPATAGPAAVERRR